MGMHAYALVCHVAPQVRGWLCGQGRATREEVEAMATEEMVEEYINKRRSELEDLCKFNIAAGQAWSALVLPCQCRVLSVCWSLVSEPTHAFCLCARMTLR